jgi:uncharacterized protein YjbJ (UPF0337 family)
MNKQQIKGLANQATGEVKQKVGRAMGDRSLEARGHAREMKGEAQEKLGNTRETLKQDQRELFDREMADRSTRESTRRR